LQVNNSKCSYNGKKDDENHSVSETLSFVGSLYKFATTCGSESVREKY